MPRGVQIGKASEKTGLTVDAIRFYEKERLLREPPRSKGGYRLYSERDIEHLLFIRKAQELGFSLAEVRELLLIQDERVEACTHVRDLIHQRLSSVREKIEALQKLERNLEEASRKCTDALTHDSSDPQHECCPVLEGIAHDERTKEKQVNDR